MAETQYIILVIAILLCAWIGTVVVEFIYFECTRREYMSSIQRWRKIKREWRGGDPDGKTQESS